VNLRNVPISDEDLPNFMIESTNREREEVEVYIKKGSKSQLNCSKSGLEDKCLIM
jgi:hypothetical protein